MYDQESGFATCILAQGYHVCHLCAEQVSHQALQTFIPYEAWHSSFPKDGSVRVVLKLQLVHIDVCGPIANTIF